MEIGFDTEKYLEFQTRKIKERLSKFENKLYLEFGGKLLCDSHAQRVLPGYKPDAKVQLLKKLDDLEIIYCVSAKDIQRGRIRHDFGLTYDAQALKEISEIRRKGLKVSAVIITRYEGENLALRFKRKLENTGNVVYFHKEIEGYPHDIQKILGPEGFPSQPFVSTTAPLLVVTGAGGGSGKMAVCLSQIYHEQKQGINAGYAKFETFPIWNLPFDHAVNTAYEAATADLGDYNMIDPFHLQKYGIKAINYNRDIENFQILKKIFKEITKEENFVNNYFSPTDMGVNMAKEGIIDDNVVIKNSKEEIMRRFYRYKQEFILGIESNKTTEYMDKILRKSNVNPDDYQLAKDARKAKMEALQKNKGNKGIYCGAALELPSGDIVLGSNSILLHAESAVILKALKKLAGIPDEEKVLSKVFIEQMMHYKQTLGKDTLSLTSGEVLVLISIAALTAPLAKRAYDCLGELIGCKIHITHIPQQGDESGLKKLQLVVSSDSELGLQPHFLE